MNTLELNNKGLLSKWLLAGILLLSFFTFAGVSIQSQATQNSLYTEAAYINQARAAKSIAYPRALKQKQYQQNMRPVFALPAIDLAYFCSLQIKTFSTSYDTRAIIKPQQTLLCQRKSFPQNTSDEPVIALV